MAPHGQTALGTGWDYAVLLNTLLICTDNEAIIQVIIPDYWWSPLARHFKPDPRAAAICPSLWVNESFDEPALSC